MIVAQLQHFLLLWSGGNRLPQPCILRCKAANPILILLQPLQSQLLRLCKGIMFTSCQSFFISPLSLEVCAYIPKARGCSRDCWNNADLIAACKGFLLLKLGVAQRNLYSRSLHSFGLVSRLWAKGTHSFTYGFEAGRRRKGSSKVDRKSHITSINYSVWTARKADQSIDENLRIRPQNPISERPFSSMILSHISVMIETASLGHL